MGASLETASGWSWGTEDRARASRHQGFGSRENFQDSPAAAFSVEGYASRLKASLHSRLSSPQKIEFASLAKEKDPEMFLAGALAFGQGLEDAGRIELAAELYSIIGAQQRLDALMGKGHSGLRAEFLLKRFTETATDYKTIVPMIAGSMAYQVIRTTALSRLAATPRLNWASRGWKLQLTSAAAGLGAESSVFLASHRGLAALAGESSAQTGSLGRDWLGTTMTLGLMKLGAWAVGSPSFVRRGLGGGRGLEVSARSRLLPLPVPPLTKGRELLSHAASFTGLLGAHQLEVATGLRPRVDGATTLTDTFGTWLSLSVGGHLGRRVLGEGWRRWEASLQVYANSIPENGSPQGNWFRAYSGPRALALATGPRTSRAISSASDSLAPRPLQMSSNGPSDPGDTPFPKKFIQELAAQAEGGLIEATDRLGEMAKQEFEALVQLVDLGMKKEHPEANRVLESLDLSFYQQNITKIHLGWLAHLYYLLELGNPSAVEFYFSAATRPGVKEHVKIMAARQLLKEFRNEPDKFAGLLRKIPVEELPERVMNPGESVAPFLLALHAEHGHSESLIALIEAKHLNPWAERFLEELHPALKEEVRALEEGPLIQVLEGGDDEADPKRGPGSYAQTKRKNTVRELFQKAKEGDLEALGLLVLMAKQNLAPGWALYELATTIQNEAARNKILTLDLSNLAQHLPDHEETRNLFFALGKAGHKNAPEMLLEAADAHAATQAWAISVLKDFADKEEPRAKFSLKNLAVDHYLDRALHGDAEAASILRLLVEQKNGSALVALWDASEHHPNAQRQLEILASTDPAAIEELKQLFPENEELQIFLGQISKSAPPRRSAPVSSSGSAMSPAGSGGTTLPPDLIHTPPRGGVMVKTSAGWVQLGVPRWTNKDAFERFAAEGGFGKPKEDVPHLIPTVYFFDPKYVPESDGLLPADFIQYMYFVSKGTTFTLVAPDAKTAERLRGFLDVSYLGLQDPQMDERVKGEYLFDPYGPANMGAETQRGFPGPDKEALRQVTHLNDQGEFTFGRALIKKIKALVYEIHDQGNYLGTVDLADFRVPQAALQRDPKIALDADLQRMRHQVLVEKRPALWPIGTGHGFTPKEETSGFMIWNQGKALIVDPPSITLEYLSSIGIPLEKIDGILLTHGHTDHHGPAVPQLLRMLPRVKLYTTPEIKRMLQSQYELAIGNHGEGLDQWNFVPLYPQQFADIIGLNLRIDYSFHTVPALGFEIYDRPDIRTGKLVLSFTGDTFADYEGVWKHTRPGPGGEAPVLSEERAFNVTRHMALLLASKGQTPPPVMLIEGGIAPIHIDPNKTRKFLGFAERLGVDTSRARLYHVGEKAAADAGVAKWQAGHGGAFELSDYYPDFKPGTLSDYVLEKIGEQPLLAQLPETVRRTLLKHGILEKVEAGRVILKEGEMDDRVYLLIDGEVEISKKEKRIAQRPSGLLGEGALLGERRNATVTTTVPSLILRWEGKEMKKGVDATSLLEDLEHIRTVRTEAYQSLLKSPLGYLPDSILDQLFRIGVVRYYRPNSVVIQQGDPTRDVFITLQGDVRIRNREKTIHVIHPEGTMLGEMALVNNAPRMATVTALDPLKVLLLPASALDKLMEEYPGIGIALKRTAESRREENGRKF